MGGIRTSTMLPCTFDTMIEDEVFAKEFWRIVIMIRPGARNTTNDTVPTLPTRFSSATEKIV